MSNIFDLFKKIEKTESTMPVSAIVVGLGNPGAKYERTRHNAGFIAIDYIAEKHGARIDRAKFSSLVGECVIGGSRVLLMKPQTFMNLSGNAVQKAAKRYGIKPERILVISDDISFNVGSIRIRKNGSAGGQKGVNNIITMLGTQEFPRIKIGAGKRPEDIETVDWVLSKFTFNELKTLSEVKESAACAVDAIINGDIELAMSKYNKTV